MPTEYFERRERALLGDRFDALYAAPQETAARGVTVSALRAAPEQFAAQADFPVEPSPFCKAGFVVQDPAFKPGRHPYHHAGVFYSQEPSASSAAPLLGVRPGMRVLDTCAAPGGKSSQLAAALGGQGLLVSNEFVAARAEVLRSNLERMGVPNAVVLNEDTGRIAAALPEFFDRVLVDAPCSGEGMFRKEAVAVTQHCEALVKQCAALGAQILDNAAACLAPGGEMIYSTCTFAPEEDEGQVAAFLQRHPEFTLADVLGKPMIYWVYKAARACPKLDDVLIATDDERIADACKTYDMRYIMTSPDHDTPTGRIWEVSTVEDADLYLQLMGDEPLVNPAAFDLTLPDTLPDDPYYVAVLTNVMEHPADVIDFSNQKVVTNAAREILLISRSPIPYPKGTLDFEYEKVTGIQLYSKQALKFYHDTPKSILEKAEENDMMRFIENGHKVHAIVSPYKTVSVDTPKDLALVNEILKEKQHG